MQRHQLAHVFSGVGDGGRAAKELRAAAVVQTHAQQSSQHRGYVRPKCPSVMQKEHRVGLRCTESESSAKLSVLQRIENGCLPVQVRLVDHHEANVFVDPFPQPVLHIKVANV